jgi:hypothetical protein
MTTASPAVPPPAGPDRDADLVLARLHLQLGSLGLARTELETLAGQGALDDEGIRDLAEARWRTGDVAGAGEAATAWLEIQPDDILGLVIAAEAQSALGRPGEARRLAGRAMERADGSLDPVFAGMPRSTIWPIDPGAASGPVGVLFDDLHPGPVAVRPLPPTPRLESRSGAAAAHGAAPVHAPIDPQVPEALHGGQTQWGEDGAAAIDDEALDPTTLFHGARVALDEGRAADAATGLILALRETPGLAPAVLDLLSGRSEPILVLVRGDAERIVGREVEAMRDHAVAATALGPPPEEHRHDGSPPATTDAIDAAEDDAPATPVETEVGPGEPAETADTVDNGDPGATAESATVAADSPPAADTDTDDGPDAGGLTSSELEDQPIPLEDS